MRVHYFALIKVTIFLANVNNASNEPTVDLVEQSSSASDRAPVGQPENRLNQFEVNTQCPASDVMHLSNHDEKSLNMLCANNVVCERNITTCKRMTEIPESQNSFLAGMHGETKSFCELAAPEELVNWNCRTIVMAHSHGSTLTKPVLADPNNPAPQRVETNVAQLKATSPMSDEFVKDIVFTSSSTNVIVCTPVCRKPAASATRSSTNKSDTYSIKGLKQFLAVLGFSTFTYSTVTIVACAISSVVYRLLNMQ